MASACLTYSLVSSRTRFGGEERVLGIFGGCGHRLVACAEKSLVASAIFPRSDVGYDEAHHFPLGDLVAEIVEFRGRA
jgi:hypothetical protein